MTITLSGDRSTSPWPDPVGLAHAEVARNRGDDAGDDDPEQLAEDREEERGVEAWREDDEDAWRRAGFHLLDPIEQWNRDGNR